MKLVCGVVDGTLIVSFYACWQGQLPLGLFLPSTQDTVTHPRRVHSSRDRGDEEGAGGTEGVLQQPRVQCLAGGEPAAETRQVRKELL